MLVKFRLDFQQKILVKFRLDFQEPTSARAQRAIGQSFDSILI
jgi:hypothetical protein